MEYLIYITWAVALCSSFVNFFFDNKKIVLWIQCVTLFFYGSHLFLLGWIATAWFLFVQIGRNIFFSKNLSDKLKKFGFSLLIMIYLYIYFMNRGIDPLSWMTLLGTILWTIGCWVRNMKIMRLLFLISTFFWIYYVFQIGSSFAIALQLVFMFWISINIIRFDILHKK